MRVALAGASGLVGRYLLRELASWWGKDGDALCSEVLVLTRRPLGVEAPAVEGRAAIREVLVDFEALVEAPGAGPLADERVDHLYCALGTTIRTAGSKEKFRRVDHDYPVALGRLGQAAGARSFGLVSSVGATPDTRNFYLRTKGETERDVAALGLPRLVVARPSIIGGHRDEFRAGEWVAKQVGKLIPGRYRTVHPLTIAVALARVVSGEVTGVGTQSVGPGGGRVVVLESEEIRRVGKPAA